MTTHTLGEDMHEYLMQLVRKDEISINTVREIMQLVKNHTVRLYGIQHVEKYEVENIKNFEEFTKRRLKKETIMADDILEKQVKIEKEEKPETNSIEFHTELKLYL